MGIEIESQRDSVNVKLTNLSPRVYGKSKVKCALATLARVDVNSKTLGEIIRGSLESVEDDLGCLSKRRKAQERDQPRYNGSSTRSQKIFLIASDITGISSKTFF